MKEYSSILAAVIPVLILSLLLLYAIYYSYMDIIYFFLFRYAGLSRIKFSSQKENFIVSELQKIRFYNNLSTKGKKFFLNRVMVFMLSKKFFGDGIKLSDEIKIYIAASAVQITFRIRRFYIDHIHLIRVFPTSVYSRLAQHRVKGLTTGAGVMWLSWDNIREGFQFPDDGINLGIHEMAHAFKLTIQNDGYHHLKNEFDDWMLASQATFMKVQEGDYSFFRKYGSTNRDEFFAVSVECFFEQPEIFANNYPSDYNSLCLLFNQDPLNSSNDYRIERNYNTSL